MTKLKVIGITFALSLSLLLTACGDEGNEEEAQDNGNVGEDTANLGEELEYTITGIEPGAGAMGLAATTIEEYENLEGWELLESSTAGMMTELGEAINNEEPIIVVGWNPHYMFASHDLKYLEDPQGTFGEKENINTITRIGLEDNMPSATKILDRFNWEVEDMEGVMLDAQDVSMEEAASTWVEDNQDKVDEWTEGVEPVDGKEIELVLTPWDSERASGEVMKLVLEEQGFQVTLTPVDPAIVFQAIANGEADASLAPWLPITHGPFYEEYKDDIVDLGPNLTGTKIGLAVPEYMDIDSIEDLQPKE
ncbi:glycine/betaine ABC transporter [Virgibacillus profundi]|uniref:Glycine/betaine ABC transporter n=1 Tax=Virgibacillus profundi TaxID=2024555 RepID=A0A2A2IEB0_9BACI|nr:glycine betaine ABC transporter substrate-binding protein [Virgibacillus profundi]PAV29656.1 glycine/betaine ABC transporter [Virgibacillus profundi]PXY53828.1 glycine/betaine ABC transporter [Virgibacillus profundi]